LGGKIASGLAREVTPFAAVPGRPDVIPSPRAADSFWAAVAPWSAIPAGCGGCAFMMLPRKSNGQPWKIAVLFLNRMEPCVYCGTETPLYVNGRPICLACSDMLEAGEMPPRKKPDNEGGKSKSTTA
jgi:hypothetical protein